MNAPFFIGWSRAIAPATVRFGAAVALALIAGAVLAALALARGTDDTGTGDFDWASGEQTIAGTLIAHPYPFIVRDDGRAILLSGEGKNGALADPALDGRLVEASGFVIRRGAIEQLQVRGDGVRAADGAAAVVRAVPLGRWRLTGEICDGKCWTGAMRPGSGIAHRACASLCVIGGIPPVFVTTAPVEGSSFLLLGAAGGGPMPAAARRLIALRVQLDGELVRVGDLLVFRADFSSARVP